MIRHPSSFSNIKEASSSERVHMLKVPSFRKARRQSVWQRSVALCLTKTRSAFEMNDIRGGRLTSYMDDIQP